MALGRWNSQTAIGMVLPPIKYLLDRLCSSRLTAMASQKHWEMTSVALQRWWSTMINHDQPWLVGGDWLPSILDVPRNIGLMSSSQLTNSYFSQGWLNHQPDDQVIIIHRFLFHMCFLRMHRRFPIIFPSSHISLNTSVSVCHESGFQFPCPFPSLFEKTR